MEWTKIPTNLINGKYSDKEILSIVKYQLLFALYEEEPNEKILNKFLTKNQKNIAKNFVADMTANVKKEIESVQKKRKNEKLKYDKINTFGGFSAGRKYGRKYNVLPEQIREDKIREYNSNTIYSINNSKEAEKEKKESFLKKFLIEYEKVYFSIPLIDEKMKAKIVELMENNPNLNEKLPQVFRNLKNTVFDFNGKKYKPNLAWLLQESNFIKFANGEIVIKKEEETKSGAMDIELIERLQKEEETKTESTEKDKKEEISEAERQRIKQVQQELQNFKFKGINSE